jgi:hypothetical protein
MIQKESPGKKEASGVLAKAEMICSQAQAAIDLLERLSADSQWAHRGSGYRGALLRALEAVRGFDRMENDSQIEQMPLQRLQSLVDASFKLLEKAAMDLIV